MVGTVGETGGLADAVVVDPVVVDVRLVGEGRPSAEHKGKLLDRLYRLGEVVRHEPPRHLRVGLFLGVVLCAPEIPQVLSSAAHGSARAGPRFLGTRPSSTGRQGSREFSDDPAVAGRPYLRIAYHLYDRFGRSSGEMSV